MEQNNISNKQIQKTSTFKLIFSYYYYFWEFTGMYGYGSSLLILTNYIQLRKMYTQI